MFWIGQVIAIIAGVVGIGLARSFISRRWPKYSENRLDVALLLMLFAGSTLSSYTYLNDRREMQAYSRGEVERTVKLVQRSERQGRYLSRREREALRKDLFRQLESSGVPVAERNQIFREWHEWDAFKYSGMICRSLPLTRAQRGDSEISSLWRGPEHSPTPGDFETVLMKHKLFTNETRELLADYKHFLETHEHRRPEVFLDHSE